MRIGLLRLDKRGVSPIIGYVLLIVLALSLAGGVYSYLVRYAPSTAQVCPEDVQLAIREVKCAGGAVNITLVNRGLFTVDGAYVRAGDPGRAAKTDLLTCEGACERYFITVDPIRYSNGLKPGESISYFKQYPGASGTKEIEVQPLIFADGNVTREILCTRAVITQTVSCS